MMEETLVRMAALTLAGIKTGSLFPYYYGSREALGEEMGRVNRLLIPRGLLLVLLRLTGRSALLYLFRPADLEKDLTDRAVRELLRCAGYPCSGCGACLHHLLERFQKEEGFPHEIGLFLSYPPEDVKGFLENRDDYKAACLWKIKFTVTKTRQGVSAQSTRNARRATAACGRRAAGCLGLAAVCGCTPLLNGKAKCGLTAAFLLSGAAAGAAALWMGRMYRAFSYDGDRQMSRQIIEGIAAMVDLPEGGVGLDVGCGSGALTIACARRNPRARFVGIDRWGKEYASFSKTLCEENAAAEGVSNVEFRQGDAVKLDFPDESFDAVTSNYVYHNIPSRDRQAILLETLRVLKKGGTFALHDIFSKSKYGDMEAFAEKLRAMGYQRVEFIDTTNGIFMSPYEAGWMALSGSALLAGKK